MDFSPSCNILYLYNVLDDFNVWDIKVVEYVDEKCQINVDLLSRNDALNRRFNRLRRLIRLI